MSNVDIMGLVTGIYDREMEVSDWQEAVMRRIEQIEPSLPRRSGSYVYDGNRCTPRQLAYWFGQRDGETMEMLSSGALDGEIEKLWHARAEAEHWYRYEKDWGW